MGESASNYCTSLLIAFHIQVCLTPSSAVFGADMFGSAKSSNSNEYLASEVFGFLAEHILLNSPYSLNYSLSRFFGSVWNNEMLMS